MTEPRRKRTVLFLCTGNVRKVHRSFDDPPRLAQSAAGEGAALDIYRRVRDEIRAFVEKELPGILEEDLGS